MQIQPFQPHVKAADMPLEKLAGSSQIPEKDKIAEVSRQFEAILLRQILASAQKTVFPSKMNPESNATGIYRDLMTNQLADQISRSGAVGLGSTLATQLDRQLKPPHPAADKAD